MKQFNVKFQREFEVSIEADTLEIADRMAKKILSQIPSPTLLTSIAEQKEAGLLPA